MRHILLCFIVMNICISPVFAMFGFGHGEKELLERMYIEAFQVYTMFPNEETFSRVETIGENLQVLGVRLAKLQTIARKRIEERQAAQERRDIYEMEVDEESSGDAERYNDLDMKSRVLDKYLAEIKREYPNSKLQRDVIFLKSKIDAVLIKANDDEENGREWSVERTIYCGLVKKFERLDAKIPDSIKEFID